MAPPAWLPPLNSHIHVWIRESSKLQNVHRKRKFKIVVNVNVNFYSEIEVFPITELPGLSLSKTDFIDVASPESVTASISLHQKFLDDRHFIPFPLHSFCWTERHYDDALPPRRAPFQLSGHDELARKISSFVLLLDAKPQNREVAMVEAVMDITKSVVVPAEEYRSWISWFEEQHRPSGSPRFHGGVRASHCEAAASGWRNGVAEDGE